MHVTGRQVGCSAAQYNVIFGYLISPLSLIYQFVV